MTEVLLNPQRLVVGFVVSNLLRNAKSIQYESAEWKPAFLRQARGSLFFPLPLREGRKRVSIFDRETRLKLEGSDPAAWSRA